MLYFLIAVLCLLIFLYPFIIYPKILKMLPKKPLFIPHEGPRPTFTLVFCAYNEEASLPEKISNIRALKTRYPALEVLAYSDLSTDATWALLQEASDVLTPVEALERLGKATGMRKLVSMATGDIVIFTDANVILDEDAIDRLAEYFSDPEIGTVAGHLKYISDINTETSELGGEYWSLEERIKAMESETGSTMGADGSIFATRREIYPEVPPHLLDDLTASINPLFLGLRVISAPDVIAFEKLTTDSGDEYRRKRRIACRAFNTHRFLAPRLRKMSGLNKFKYTSHKFIRWMSPMFLGLAGLFTFLGLLATLGWAGMILSILLVVLFWSLWKSGQTKIRKIAEILIALLATGMGVVESLRGKTYQTWVPAKSRN